VFKTVLVDHSSCSPGVTPCTAPQLYQSLQATCIWLAWCPPYLVPSLPMHQGYAGVCGLDEAGRGPWAGPVVAGACVLPPGE
jgi:hypothetical protein